MKTKSTAMLLALLLGGIGGHKFYLGQTGQGLLYFFFCWTLLPALIALLECIIFLTMSEHEFNRRYNSHLMMAQPMGAQMGQNVTINLGSDQLKGLGSAPVNLTDELHKLRELNVSGALTDEEYAIQKQRLLS